MLCYVEGTPSFMKKVLLAKKHTLHVTNGLQVTNAYLFIFKAISVFKSQTTVLQLFAKTSRSLTRGLQTRQGPY